MEQKRICKRCLLREYDEKDYKEKILKLLVDVKNDNPKRFGNKIDMLIERTE